MKHYKITYETNGETKSCFSEGNSEKDVNNKFWSEYPSFLQSILKVSVLDIKEVEEIA